MSDLTAERLRELVHYDPDTGVMTWRVCVGSRGVAGALVGGRHSAGYIKAQVDGSTQFVHRLAWLYMTGEWPTSQVDHANGTRDDNRWANLRQATRSQNVANSKCRADSISGYKGVRYDAARRPDARWVAHISVNKRTHFLGAWRTAEEAHAAYTAAAERYFGEFARAA